MIYRAVKKSDRRYYVQYRHCFFWWRDSTQPSWADPRDAIHFAKANTDPRPPPPPPPPHVVDVVWP